jgi:hypothetical protein
LEHRVVGFADQLAVLGGDAVEWAVAKADGAVGLVVGLLRICCARAGISGRSAAERAIDLGWS